MRLIDADALIDEIKYIVGQDTIMWFDDRKIKREQEVNMCALIERMPTIDPVKHGKWVLITKDYIDPQEYMCSVCGRTIKYYGIPTLLLEMYPYCNCGAKMDNGRSKDEET